MNGIKLTLARLGDAPRMAEMSRTLIESDLPWTWTPRRIAAHMRQRENLSVIASHGGELAGFVMAQFGSERVHVALLGVAASFQRHGLGRQLIQWVEESAVVAGLFHVRLEVRASNRQARRFYAALGYFETGSAPRYYSGIEDAIQLSRNLRVEALRDG